MAVILKFPSEIRPASLPPVMAGASADILFFTGVRYERAGASADRKPQRRQRRRRTQGHTKSA